MSIITQRRRLSRGLALSLLAIGFLCGLAGPAAAGPLDDIGVTALRAADPTLTGSGIAVIQAEANYGGTNVYQVNPAYVDLPPGLFTYVDGSGGIWLSYPNGGGSESGHADSVGLNFYGNATSGPNPGVAPGVSSVDNYQADTYFNAIIAGNLVPSAASGGVLHDARVINQSFIFTDNSGNALEDPVADQLYDNYAANYNVLFVSGMGNGTPPASPATCYNGIAVAVIDGNSTTGPTLDDGRCKPDITAPGGATSFSTPYVSGAAALLMQAAGDNAAASDIRTIKALLLNGATKPAGWTHTPTQPLDLRYGAGELNVFNSWQELSAGNQPFSTTQTLTAGTLSHAPSSASNFRGLTGWDFTQLTSSASLDAMNNYFLAPNQSGAAFTLTATLVWNRQAVAVPTGTNPFDITPIGINNLDLFLYDMTNPALLASSVSTVNNVQQLYVTGLAPGDTYAIQVWKPGGDLGPGLVSYDETYALAYSMTAVPEPSALVLFGVGAIGLLGWHARRRRA